MRAPRLLALILAAQLMVVATAAAAPPHAGSVDRSFGTNGRVKLSLPGERVRPSAVLVQPDGRIVVAGTLVAPGQYSYRGPAFAARFEADGELDTGFGENGVARVASSTPLAIDGAALQPDGALLLSGTTTPEGGSILGAVVRLSAAGHVDEGFGSGGIARIPPAGVNPYPPGVQQLSHVAAMPDGRIVAAGSQDSFDPHTASEPYVVRLMRDGTPDTGFGGEGRASIGTSNPIALLVRPNGEVVIVGWDERFFGGTDLNLLRLGADADPSPAFASHSYRSWVRGIAASLRPDGTIAFVGEMITSPGKRVARRWIARALIGPELQLLERGKVATTGFVAATFDRRGAVLTAGPWLAEAEMPPWQIARYRDIRRHDLSFGDRHGNRLVNIDPPSGSSYTGTADLTGLAMQGAKLIVAGYSHPSRQPNDGQSLTLIRLNARQDESGPRLDVSGLPHRRCQAGTTELVVHARDESRTTTRAWIDRRRLARSTRHRFRTELDATKLKPGRHRLRIRSHDAAGNLGARSWTVRVCG